jgi:hypothetical protein
MRRVRLVKDGRIVGHVEVYGLLPTGPGDYLGIPDGVLSDPDLQALAEALDRGEVAGRLGDGDWPAFLETAALLMPGSLLLVAILRTRHTSPRRTWRSWPPSWSGSTGPGAPATTAPDRPRRRGQGG